MALNLALSQQHLIDNAIISKLEGGDAPTDDKIARISFSTARTIRRRIEPDSQCLYSSLREG